MALTPGNPSTAVSDNFAATANMSYRADYLGNANYAAVTGACEPLTVTPVPAPTIAIVKNPAKQSVAVGGTAKFKITVTNAGNTVLTNVTVSRSGGAELQSHARLSFRRSRRWRRARP